MEINVQRSVVKGGLKQLAESFSNNNGDSNENFKKAIGLLSKTANLHMYHAFLYISLLSLHDYDMIQMPNSMFYGGRKQAMTNLSFSF